MANVALEPLDTAIDGLLALDPEVLTDAELDEVVVAVERQSHRLAAVRARLISAWAARGVWADDGSRSPAHRLARDSSMSVSSGRTELRRARALRSMPHTAAALADGDLSPDHVDLLARANDGSRRAQFSEHEQMLVRLCKPLRYAEAGRVVEYWRQHADAAACEDEAHRQHDSRHATVAVTLDDMVDVQAWLDPIGGAAFKHELDRLERRLYLDDKRTGQLRTVRQRRADALVEMAKRSRTARPGSLRPRPLVTILCGEDSFAHTCELATGRVITPGQVVPLLADADIERIVFDGPDRVITVSRRRRFTGALRRAIEVRDRHCEHPSGCDEPADNCDVDHKTPYSAGGLTSQDNGPSNPTPTTVTSPNTTDDHPQPNHDHHRRQRLDARCQFGLPFMKRFNSRGVARDLGGNVPDRPPSAAPPQLSVVDVSKSFGSTHALRGVSLELSGGEIHGLVGENGAGKSTLIKVMTGLYPPDTGHITIDGNRVELRNPADAQEIGIACIFQEPLVFPDLTVSENIFMGQPEGGPLVRWRDMHERAAEILRLLEVDLDPRAPASQLTVAGQQAVEIAKAMSRRVRVLIMDEPTAALSAHEVHRLFRQVRRLAASGVAILFVSHRLDEVFELADRITVLRDGQHISTKPAGDVTEVSLIRDMVGRELSDFFRRVAHEPGDVALSVEALGRQGAFEDVSFAVRSGEVFGFAGLVGSGRTEVAEALFGVRPAESGTIRRDGREVEIRSPQEAMALGIAYVSEDRRRLGLSLPQSVTANITLPGLRKFVSRWRLLDRHAERRAADVYRQRLRIMSPSLVTPVGNLSGGNQQKVMLAKWLETKPSVLILDEPTRGVDVGAKADVHELIGELARSGVAVILISSDLPEVLAMSDRVLVMREGRGMGIFAGSQLEQERIMTAAVGLVPTAD